jgi:hypothetical protein
MSEGILYRNEWGCLKVDNRGLVFSTNGEEHVFLLKVELDLLLEALHNICKPKRKLKDRLDNLLKIAQLIHGIIDKGLDRIGLDSIFGKKILEEVDLEA